MSAGVCGKRAGFEELFGSSSQTNKRSRYSNFGSAELVPGSDDPVWVSTHMFPSVDPEMVKMVLSNNNIKIEDAKESLHTLSFSDAVGRINTNSFVSATSGYSQVPDHERPNFDYENAVDGSKWVDLFVSEMMNAANIDDASQRAATFLEAFEKCMIANTRATKEVDNISWKENLQNLLNDNRILKRAVAIQNERNLEQDERIREMHHLKVVTSQYQEQVQKLELNNYALKLHLQRAQGSSSFPGHLPPDIY